MPTEAVLTVEPTTITEGAGPTTLTVTAAWKGEGVRNSATEISLTVQGGTASSADYSVTLSVLVIAADAASGTGAIVVTALSDTLREGNETVRVIGTSSGITVSDAEVTILDRLPSMPTEAVLTVEPTTITEGAGPTTLTVTAAWKGEGVRNSATEISLTVQAGTASSADYSVTPSVLVIAADAASGTGAIAVTALSDTLREGNETVKVVGTSSGITVSDVEVTILDRPTGPNLEVDIVEGEGMPCPGVVVRASSPQRRESVTRTTLTMDWESGVRGGFDWVEPYHDDEDNPESRGRTPVLEVNVAQWRVERIRGGAARHTLEIDWPPFLEVGLRFRSDAGNCEFPTLVCSARGCELRP